MKSSTEHTGPNHVPDEVSLRTSIQKEKDELVSMFLTNASLTQLTEQFKRIDELNEKITRRNGSLRKFI